MMANTIQLFSFQIMSSAVSFFISARNSGKLGIFVLIIHQAILSLCGGSEYIVSGLDGNGGRQGGLLDANREGIFSLLGCLSIYLFGVYLGQVIFMKRLVVIVVWTFEKQFLKIEKSPFAAEELRFAKNTISCQPDSDIPVGCV